MTDRERWIVYPLIFLALGVALRDKITRTLGHVERIGGETVEMDLKRGIVAGEQTQAQIDFAQGLVLAKTVRCENLIVEREADAKQLATGRLMANEMVLATPAGEVRIVFEALPKPDSKLPGSDQVGGRIVIFGQEGKAQVLLAPGKAGGEVSVVDESLRLRVNFGGFQDGVMLAGETAGGHKIPFLTLPPALTPSLHQTEKPEGEKLKEESPQTKSESPGPPEPEE